MKKGCLWGAIIFLILALVGTIWGFFRYYYVISDGTKSGVLTDFTKKGYVFKTYEGKMVMEGLKNKTAGSIETNELLFSVEKEDVADMLNKLSGKNLQLHYYRFNNALPWRGYSDYVVDSIVSIDYIPTKEYFERIAQGTLNQVGQTNTGIQTSNDVQVATVQPQAVTYEEALRQLNAAQQEYQRAQLQLQQILQQQKVQIAPQNSAAQSSQSAPSNSGVNQGGTRQYKSPSQD